MSVLNFAFFLDVGFVFVTGAVQWKGQWTEVVAKRSLDSRCRETEREKESLGHCRCLSRHFPQDFNATESLNASHDYLPAVLGDKQCLCFISKNIVAVHKISDKK